MRREGGCRETRWKEHPHCLVQDTLRYLALSPVCHYLPLWGWLSQVLSSLAGSFLETEAETPGVLSKTRQRSKNTASQWNRKSISSVVTPPLCPRAPDLGSHLDSPFAPGTPKFSSCSPSLHRLSPTSPCPPQRVAYPWVHMPTRVPSEESSESPSGCQV